MNIKVQGLGVRRDAPFSKAKPILVTVDPISSAILRVELVDKRSAEVWKHHWNCIEDDGYIALYLVCDCGTALEKAHKDSLSDAIKQPDTYHAVAHILGIHLNAKNICPSFANNN